MIIIIIVLDEEEMEDDYTPLIYPEAGIILLDNVTYWQILCSGLV